MQVITVEFLTSEIVPNGVTFTRLGTKLTHCQIETKSGFVFTGESACVDPSRYNQAMGEKIAYQNALDKMWEPYGLWLSKILHDKNKPDSPELLGDNNS